MTDKDIDNSLECFRCFRSLVTPNLPPPQLLPPSRTLSPVPLCCHLGRSAVHNSQKSPSRSVAWTTCLFVLLWLKSNPPPPSPTLHTYRMYCAGSPLGLFLALRGTDPSKGRALGTPSAGASTPSPTSTPDGLPAANRIYNLYQPYDPVAYRSLFFVFVFGLVFFIFVLDTFG